MLNTCKYAASARFLAFSLRFVSKLCKLARIRIAMSRLAQSSRTALLQAPLFPKVLNTGKSKCSGFTTCSELHRRNNRGSGPTRTKCTSSRRRRAWSRQIATPRPASPPHIPLHLPRPGEVLHADHLMRAYASLATSSSSSSLSEQWQQAGPSTSSLTPSRNLSASSAAVETQALAVIARDLLNLLITATGKTPGKQRLVAWPDTEGGPDEEEEWVRRLESVISRTDLANKVAPRTVIAGKRNSATILLSKVLQLTCNGSVLSSSSLEAAEFSQALLSDPLASDQAHSKLLADRSKTTDFNVRKDHIYSLVYDTPAQHSPDDNAAADQANMSRIPSQFLRKNNVELREIVYNHCGSCRSSDCS